MCSVLLLQNRNPTSKNSLPYRLHVCTTESWQAEAWEAHLGHQACPLWPEKQIQHCTAMDSSALWDIRKWGGWQAIQERKQNGAVLPSCELSWCQNHHKKTSTTLEMTLMRQARSQDAIFGRVRGLFGGGGKAPFWEGKRSFFPLFWPIFLPF